MKQFAENGLYARHSAVSERIGFERETILWVQKGDEMKKDMDSEIFPAWVTAHALSSGIEAVMAQTSSSTPTMIFWRDSRFGTTNYAYHEGKDWHRTPQGALARAEIMRKAKIASHQKSIAKLEKMGFTAKV